MLRLLLTLALLLWATTAWAQPVYDAVSGSSTASAASLTFAHTLGSGSNRALYCWVGTMGNGVAISTVTYDGDSMTEILEEGGAPTFAALALYRIIDAGGLATGSANVVVTPNSNAETFAACMSFSGVDQATPNDTVEHVNLDDGSAAQTATSASGDLVAQGAFCQADAGAASATTANTERRDSMQQGYMLSFAQTATGAASVGLDWTLNTGICAAFRAMAVSLNPSGGGGGGSTTGRLLLLGVGR